MKSIKIDSVLTIFYSCCVRNEHEITKEKVESIINKLLDKARKIRNHSKKANDQFIKASNNYIEVAEIVNNLFVMATTCTKKNKKYYNFKG